MFDRILEVVGNVAVILLVNTPRQIEKKKVSRKSWPPNRPRLFNYFGEIFAPQQIKPELLFAQRLTAGLRYFPEMAINPPPKAARPLPTIVPRRIGFRRSDHLDPNLFVTMHVRRTCCFK
jgi:hypothetical protein